MTSSETTSFNLYAILEELKSTDADFRYMALNDLTTHLSDPQFTLNQTMEDTLLPAILDLVKSPNGGVQNMAIKCLASMANKLQKRNLEAIVDKLAELLQPNHPDEVKDIANLGLKSMILELPPNSDIGVDVTVQLVPILLRLILNAPNQMIQVDLLDLLLEISSRFCLAFGQKDTLLPHFHTTLVPLLHHPRPVVRKRAAMIIAILTPLLAADPYQSFLKNMLQWLQPPLQDPEKYRTLLYCFQCMAKQSEPRFLPYLMPLLETCLLMFQQDNDELKESLFQCLEALVSAFPSQLTPVISNVLRVALTQLQHDPNYLYSSSQEAVNEGDGNGDDDDADGASTQDLAMDIEESSSEYSDDDDLSWKVRRASASFLSTFVQTHPLPVLLPHLREILTVLIRCFKEREASVKLDMLNTTLQLFKSMNAHPELARPLAIEHLELCTTAFHQHVLHPSLPMAQRHIGVILVRHLVLLHMDGLDPLLNSALDTLPSSTLGLKLDLLQLCAAYLPYSSPTSEVRTRMLSFLLEGLEALDVKRVAETFQTLRTWLRSSTLTPMELDAIYQRITQPSSFSELSFDVLALVVVQGATEWIPHWSALWLDKLKSERFGTQAALLLHSILFSERLPMGKEIPNFVFGILSILKNRNSAMIEACLVCLNIMVQRYPSYFPESAIDPTLESLPPFLDSSKPSLASESFQLATGLLKLYPTKASWIFTHIIPPLCTFLTTSLPVLSSSARLSLLQFIQTCVEHGANLTPTLMELDPSQPSLLSKAIAASIQPSQLSSFLDPLLSTLRHTTKPPAYRHLLIATLGELGLKYPLPDAFEVLFPFLESEEELKAAAAVALGQLTVTVPDAFQGLLQRWEQHPPQRYLLFHAVQQAIKVHAPPPVHYFDLLWNTLGVADQDEGTRNLLGECLGLLCLAHPQRLDQLVQQGLTHANPEVRATLLVAVKLVLPKNASLLPCLDMIQDKDVHVRRVALSCFLTAAHTYPADLLTPYLSHVHRETFLRPELIREVTMGPFKHTLDDGLETRKLAYECILVLPSLTFLDRVVAGLSDVHDILLLALMILVKLPLPNETLEGIVDNLEACLVQPKQGDVKQDVEKAYERHQAVLKTVARIVQQALPHPSGVAKTWPPKFLKFLQTLKTGPMADSFQQWLKSDK